MDISKYWKHIALIVAVVAAFFFIRHQINLYNQGIKDAERSACNSEWIQKNNDAERKLKEEVEDVKSKRKVIQNNSRPAGKLALIGVLEDGRFTAP